MKDTDISSTFIPIDFNSLATLEASTLRLSDYYMDYAFTSEGVNPTDGMTITFYDKSWAPNTAEIVCLDAVLKEKPSDIGSWSAEVEGSIYTSHYLPERAYFSPFIGATTHLLEGEKKAAIQKLGLEPNKDVLAGIQVFMFRPGSKLPNFAVIIGMNSERLTHFFAFSKLSAAQPEVLPNGKLADNTLVVRGGGNKL